jgi:UDP-N-acetylenolpyruvoylglucosamine reductase
MCCTFCVDLCGPITRNTQHATRNTQHATRNTQHATRNTQHATRNTQHATRNTQHKVVAGLGEECPPVTRELVAHFLASLHRRGLLPSTAGAYLASPPQP